MNKDPDLRHHSQAMNYFDAPRRKRLGPWLPLLGAIAFAVCALSFTAIAGCIRDRERQETELRAYTAWNRLHPQYSLTYNEWLALRQNRLLPQ